jgi:hypothetical protein
MEEEPGYVWQPASGRNTHGIQRVCSSQTPPYQPHHAAQPATRLPSYSTIEQISSQMFCTV